MNLTELAWDVARQTNGALSTRWMRIEWADLGDGIAGTCIRYTNGWHRIYINEQWRFAPEWILRGVIAHELAHMKTIGHGDAFYRVANQSPDFETYEDWKRSCKDGWFAVARSISELREERAS